MKRAFFNSWSTTIIIVLLISLVLPACNSNTNIGDENQNTSNQPDIISEDNNDAEVDNNGNSDKVSKIEDNKLLL